MSAFVHGHDYESEGASLTEYATILLTTLAHDGEHEKHVCM